MFQQILNDETPIDQRSLDEAFETLYNKDRKYDWNTIDFDRFRTDILEVKFFFSNEINFLKLFFILER